MAVNTIGLSREFIIHPGETLAEVIEDRDMSQHDLADAAQAQQNATEYVRLHLVAGDNPGYEKHGKGQQETEPADADGAVVLRFLLFNKIRHVVPSLSQ